jgi:hypothetical protein
LQRHQIQFVSSKQLPHNRLIYSFRISRNAGFAMLAAPFSPPRKRGIIKEKLHHSAGRDRGLAEKNWKGAFRHDTR